MRLGAKSRRLLDLLACSAFDALGGLVNLRAFFAASAGWSHERHFRESLELLGKEGWITWDDARESGAWVAKLTRDGLEAVWDGIDPEKEWEAPWDGMWRSISFDLPQAARSERRQLDLWLKKRRFGHLQGSVWISHRQYTDWTSQIEKRQIDPAALLFQESRPVGKVKGRDYVGRAWDFDAINDRYKRYIAFSESNCPENSPQERFPEWFAQESRYWQQAFELDPFLPTELLPKSYLGKEAYALRMRSLRTWGQIITGGHSPA